MARTTEPIPPELTVGPHTYTVRTDTEAAHRTRSEGRLAHTHIDQLLIELDPDRPPSTIAESLLHETLHACWHQAQLNTQDALQEHEEHVVTMLAPSLLDVLRRNPGLVRYLTTDTGGT